MIDADKFGDARAALQAELDVLEETPVQEAELGKVVKQFVSATLGTRKTMEGQAQTLGDSWIIAHDLDFDDRYLEAVKRLKAHSDLENVLATKNLDAILAPSNGPAWTIDFVNGDHFEGGAAASPAIAGIPHITVPCGDVHKLPIGLSLFGPKQSEAALLGMAYAFEQATRARVEPGFQK